MNIPHWVAQISANLLRDEELVDLIAESGGKWIFIGMESIDPANLKDVNKGFNKPGEYAGVLERLAQRNVYAITSFIFGVDNDTVQNASGLRLLIRRKKVEDENQTGDAVVVVVERSEEEIRG